MNEQSKKWHHDVLATHENILFETLIYPHNLITDTVKFFTFEDKDEQELKSMRGYLAIKEAKGRNCKYFIEDIFYDHLPIRANKTEELYLKDNSKVKSILIRPLDPTPFKIIPENVFSDIHKFIDDVAPFEHSHPLEWTLAKIVGLMGYIGKTFIGMCSSPEFGKSGIYEILHSLTTKSPVFQPRSVPGILTQITGDGNMVFDEVHKSTKETKQCMENFTLQVAGNKPVYINGALKSSRTKSKYNVSQQSMTYLYNLKENYSNAGEEFFDYFFSNNDAIDSRLLKLRFGGILKEKFDKNFNILATAEQNKMYYINIAKQLLFLKKIKFENKYDRKYVNESLLNLTGRHKIIYDEITWLVDMYCNSQEEYDKLINTLDNCIINYKNMVDKTVSYKKPVQEELVK